MRAEINVLSKGHLGLSGTRGIRTGPEMCETCRDEAQFRVIPIGMKMFEERCFLACQTCLVGVILKSCFHSYIVRNMEWED